MSNLNNLDLNNFNKLVEQARNAVMCDSNCQKEKNAEELKRKYLASQTNLASAGSQLNEAQKNYVTFTQGELAYNNQKQDELHKKAQLIVNKFNDNLNKYIQQINLQINTYNGLTTNFKNVTELYFKYRAENVFLTKRIKDNTSDILTNDRKTYYENQGIDTLNFVYYYILASVYVIFVIAYIVSAFLYQSQMNWKFRVIIFVLLVFLPSIAPWLLGLAIEVAYKIYDLLPKNVHLTV